VCLYIVCAFSLSLKCIDLVKKQYLKLQAFFYKDILGLDREYAENNWGVRVIGSTVEFHYICGSVLKRAQKTEHKVVV